MKCKQLNHGKMVQLNLEKFKFYGALHQKGIRLDIMVPEPMEEVLEKARKIHIFFYSKNKK